jgi:hypothetical protein
MTAGCSTQLGFSMDGLEPSIERLIRSYIWPRFKDAITYVEIGIGHGGTLGGIAEMLKNCPPPCRWRVIGVELPEGYSFCRDNVYRSAQTRHIPIQFIEDFGGSKLGPQWNAITVYLCDSQRFFPCYWDDCISLALIDGCHGRACVMADFLNIKKFIEPGGVVMFHDYGEEEQGLPQTHCRLLDVRGACAELFENNEQWKFVAEWIGDKQKAGANMGVFRKET